MIRVENLNKSFENKPVLQNLTLTVGEGVTCLMGPSGSGKTTLLRILLGLETAESGSVQGMPEKTAVLFQEDRLVENITVRGNLRLALGKAYAEETAQKCLTVLGIGHTLGEQVRMLSGGMRRRAALARALLYDAPLMILDEPFKGLDEDSRRQTMDIVRADAIRRPVLMVTHDRTEAEYLGAKLLWIGGEPAALRKTE